MRQQQQYNAQQQQIHFAGNNPQDIHATVGQLPTPRQWSNYGQYIDLTHQVSDLYKLQLTWSAERDNAGNVQPGAVQSKKAASGTLTFEGEAYQLLRRWLIDDVSAPLNAVTVLLQHKGGATCTYDYVDWQIKATDLEWCEDGICSFDVTLKQKDEALHCIKSTLVADNHQGWFSQQPDGGKRHPRFSYCNEARPNGMMVMQWWHMGFMMGLMITFAIPMLLAINPILWILQQIENVLNAIPGVNVDWNIPEPIGLDDLKDGWANFFIESAGCGREHPAPLIRDYISNVCSKCGIHVDATTAPIFFSQKLRMETSNRAYMEHHNPHYNACYLSAPVQRGIRRMRNIGLLGFTEVNDTDFYIPGNSPILMLDMLLDELKQLYNAEWRVKDGTLYFQRKDWWLEDGYVYDFTENSADRLKILQGICFSYNEIKYPAVTSGIYQDDPVDTCGNEAKRHMNALCAHGNTDENPNFEGLRDIVSPFGATRFRLDGVSEDCIFDAMQILSNGAIFNVFINAQLKGTIYPAFDEYADYALLLSDETCMLPKVLLWDGNSYMNAKVIKPHRALSATTPEMPAINPKYNPDNTPWYNAHDPETFVRGSGLTFGQKPPGRYVVQDYFGNDIANKPALLVNYPMYFEPNYYDTLWDWFHYLDDPGRNPKLHLN